MARPRLIEDWKSSHRFWSVRLALFWGAFNGAVIALAAFSDRLNPWWFLGLNTAGYGIIAVARIMKQPGLDD